MKIWGMCLPASAKGYLSQCFLCTCVYKGAGFRQNGDAQRTHTFYDSESFWNLGLSWDKGVLTNCGWFRIIKWINFLGIVEDPKFGLTSSLPSSQLNEFLSTIFFGFPNKNYESRKLTFWSPRVSGFGYRCFSEFNRGFPSFSPAVGLINRLGGG